MKSQTQISQLENSQQPQLLFDKQNSYFQQFFQVIYTFYFYILWIYLEVNNRGDDDDNNNNLIKELHQQRRNNYGENTYISNKLTNYFKEKNISPIEDGENKMFQNVFENKNSIEDLQLECYRWSISRNYSKAKYIQFKIVKLDDHPTENNELQIQGRVDAFYLINRFYTEQQNLYIKFQNTNFFFLIKPIMEEQEHEEEQINMQQYQQQQQQQQQNRNLNVLMEVENNFNIQYDDIQFQDDHRQEQHRNEMQIEIIQNKDKQVTQKQKSYWCQLI